MKSGYAILIGILFGVAGAWLVMRDRDPVANTQHLRSVAVEDSLTRVGTFWKDSAARAQARATDYKAQRVFVVQKVRENPDSIASARGIPVTIDSAGLRCLPLPSFTELLAASEALPYCDSALGATEARAQSAESSATLFQSAYDTAREDASLQAARASLAEERLGKAKRRAWWFAAAGAAAGAASVILVGGGR